MKAITMKRVLLHAAFWIFYLLISTAYYTQGVNYGVELPYQLALLPFPILFTYFQLYVFIPKLLLKKKTISYLLVSIPFAKLVTWHNFLCYDYFVAPVKYGTPRGNFWFEYPWAIHIEALKSVFSFVMICGVAVSIKLLKKWYLENERNQKIEKEKLGMELEMLKAQVHPHFLFNTLNNLYSLTLTHSDNAPVVVTHLSGLLRYMLYECNEKEVSLNNEIAALKKYVELEKLRYGNRLDVSFSCTGPTAGLVIAPLLLLPFVENSFKHGVSDQLDQCWINIHLHAEGNQLTFNLSNSCNKEKLPAINGGIGLVNINKRLELIYVGHYNLHITQQDEMYAVKLTMQLSQLMKLAANNETSFSNTLPAAAI
ncbi:MAG: putative signal transduction histidine kinase [Flavisolibacter sp.]|nr:putative signal transduction histidine kinase [Flavisolibacter sp.]